MTIGTLELTSKYRYGLTSRGVPIYLFVPYDTTLPHCIVGCSHRDLSRNQIAEISVEDWSPEKPRGNLIRLIGPSGDYAAEKEAILRHYSGVVPKSTALEEVEDTSDRMEISAETGWKVFHIDPPGCRDIDDAVAWHAEKKIWSITIADVASIVRPGSALDARARAIGSTFYDLNGRVLLPMLPPAISEESGSLLPGERRRGITLVLDENGNPAKFDLSWITVAESYTYDSVVGHPLVASEPHEWIEKHMIQYNSAVAALLKSTGVGILRTQPRSDADAVAHWKEIDPELGFMAMEAASYDLVAEKEQSHASLGLYCHASSPLRRYADLVNQRCLTELIRTGSVAPIDDCTEHLNARMKANRRFTRDLTFLEYVPPGRVHTIDVKWLSNTQVWVPKWRRILRLRHEQAEPTPQIAIFCDPTKRNWKQRVLTAQTG